MKRRAQLSVGSDISLGAWHPSYGDQYAIWRMPSCGGQFTGVALDLPIGHGEIGHLLHGSLERLR